MPPRLRHCADRLGVRARVHFVPVRDGAFAALLSSSTLFAAVSDHGTGSLLDVARALACGVPVIAADAPRTSCLVRDDENGLVAPAGDVEHWTEALRHAASSRERRKRWGRTARRIAEERLSWPAVAARFESCFAQPMPTATQPARLDLATAENAELAARGTRL